MLGRWFFTWDPIILVPWPTPIHAFPVHVRWAQQSLYKKRPHVFVSRNLMGMCNRYQVGAAKYRTIVRRILTHKRIFKLEDNIWEYPCALIRGRADHTNSNGWKCRCFGGIHCWRCGENHWGCGGLRSHVGSLNVIKCACTGANKDVSIAIFLHA